MGIKPRFNQSDIEKKLSRFFDVIQNRAIARMQMLGEMCVIHAKSIPAETGYTDRTGALRSSTGYTVFHNGNAVHENFETVNGNSEGIEAGKKLCREVAEKNHKGIQLVVVAGMNYSVYLESKGHDVLSSAEQLAENELPRMLNELKRNIAAALQSI